MVCVHLYSVCSTTPHGPVRRRQKYGGVHNLTPSQQYMCTIFILSKGERERGHIHGLDVKGIVLYNTLDDREMVRITVLEGGEIVHSYVLDVNWTVLYILCIICWKGERERRYTYIA